MSYTRTQKLTKTGEYSFCYPPAKFRQGTARSPTENYPSIQLFGHCCDFVRIELRQKSKKINTRKFLAQLYPAIALSELNPSLKSAFGSIGYGGIVGFLAKLAVVFAHYNIIPYHTGALAGQKNEFS